MFRKTCAPILSFMFFLPKRNRKSGPPAVPDGIRVYAIGDIHGRDDLLARLHATIKADAATGSERNVIIYLGDYVDRGITSKEVVERLVGGADLPGFETTFLIG
ncbi:MAG: metallophosphoesterase, partial [Pseudomonadota bacterium]|nr:metallophosphoesterase [Pseudomonadota bacterium]